MPKLKTKSSVKKRFTQTGSGKLKCGQAGKRHGMTKRSKRQLRNLRGTTLVAACDYSILKMHLPYGLN